MLALGSEASKQPSHPNRRSSLSPVSRRELATTSLVRPSTSSYDSGSSGHKILEPSDFRRPRKYAGLLTAAPCSSPLSVSFTTSSSPASPVDSNPSFPAWGQAGISSRLCTMPQEETVLNDRVSSSMIKARGVLADAVQHWEACPQTFATASRERPYTASSVTSATQSSLSSYHDSWESERRPLMSSTAATRETGLHHKRSATSGNLFDHPIKALVQAQQHVQANHRDRHEAAFVMSTKQRTQRIKSARKLAHVLGEESQAGNLENGQKLTNARSRSPHWKRPTEQPQHISKHAVSVSAVSQGTRNDERQAEPHQVSQKAAAVLGIHPYSSAATPSRATSLSPKPCPVGARSSNDAETCAASDEEQAAFLRGMRRRRLAKMSRWLGEAIPVELISSTTTRNHHKDDQHDKSDETCHIPWADVLATHCAQSDTLSQSFAPYEDRRGSNPSPMESFMSVDSSDSEDESAESHPRRFRRPASSTGTPAPLDAEVGQEPCADVSDLPQGDILTRCERSERERLARSSTLDDVPRRSAAFLDLADTESCVSQPGFDATIDDTNLAGVQAYQTTPYVAASASDRSISKLSNFFGSTPSQIVRSQSELGTSTCPFGTTNNLTSLLTVGVSRTKLKSVEDEVMEMNKSDALPSSRKLWLMKRRTTQLFS